MAAKTSARGRPAHKMKLSPQLAKIALLLGLVVSFVGIQPASAQDSAVSPAAVVISNEPITAARPVADTRPLIVIMNFESGTVAAKVKDKHGFSAFMAAMRGDR